MNSELTKSGTVASSRSHVLFRGSAIRVLNLVAQGCVSFVMMPFVVGVLGDRMYGLWSLLGSIVGYYGLLDLGLSAAVGRQVANAIGAENQHSVGRIYSTSLAVYSILGIAVVMASFLLASFSEVFWADPADARLFEKVIHVSGLTVAISMPFRVYIGLLTANLRYDIIAFVQIGSLVLRTVLAVVVLLYGGQVLALSIVTLISSIPAHFFTYHYSRKTSPSLPRFQFSLVERATLKPLLKYSMFAFLAQIADLLRFELDFLVITKYVGLAAVTHYKVASFMAAQFLAFVRAFAGVLVPFFGQLDGARDNKRIVETLFFGTKCTVYVASFIAFGFIAWGKPFVQVWMGDAYLDSYPCLVLLTLGSLVALWQTPSVSLLYGTSKHRFYALFNWIEGLSNLALSLILVRNYGLVGVAAGTCIPMVIVKLLMQPIYVCRVCSIGYGAYLRTLSVAVCHVLAALILPALVTSFFVRPHYPTLVGVGSCSALAYLGFLWFLGLNDRERRILSTALLSRHRRAASS